MQSILYIVQVCVIAATVDHPVTNMDMIGYASPRNN